MLRAIGYWRDEWEGPGPDQWRAVPQLILAKPGARAPERRLVKYLRGGHQFELYRGWSSCRFKCGVEDSSMGHADLTDGTWVWPEGLVHYVVVHRLVLPEQFVDHAIAHKGKVPPLPADIQHMEPALKAASVDRRFWNDWFTRVANAAG